MPNPIDGFTVDRAAIAYVGHDLQRPECILAEPDGTLWSADARGAYRRVSFARYRTNFIRSWPRRKSRTLG